MLAPKKCGGCSTAAFLVLISAVTVAPSSPLETRDCITRANHSSLARGEMFAWNETTALQASDKAPTLSEIAGDTTKVRSKGRATQGYCAPRAHDLAHGGKCSDSVRHTCFLSHATMCNSPCRETHGFADCPSLFRLLWAMLMLPLIAGMLYVTCSFLPAGRPSASP